MTHLSFDHELDSEQTAAIDRFAGEKMSRGRFAKTRGWRDRKNGGWIFRNEDDARAAAEMAGNKQAVKDNQPLSLDDVRNATGMERADAQGQKATERRKQDNTKDKEPKNEGKFNLVSDERMEELKRRLREKLRSQMNVGVDPEMLSIGMELAVGYVDRGVKKFSDFVEKMIGDMGDGIRPYLKAFYNGMRDMPEITSKGYDKELTSYEEVRSFDVAGFDKHSTGIVEKAKMRANEERANADADTNHPKETFEVKGSGEMKTKSSGKWYVVTQASLSAKPHKDIFSSKEEAEKFAKAYMKNDGKKVNKYRYASAPQEVKEFDGYSEYAVVLRRKNIGKGTTTDFKLKHYNTADEQADFVVSRVKDFDNGKREETGAEEAMKKESGLSFGNGKAKRSVKFGDFIPDRRSEHQQLRGIHYDNGMAVVSDDYRLVAIRTEYPAEYEGRTLMPNGREAKGRFPNWRVVVPNVGIEIGTDWLNRVLGLQLEESDNRLVSFGGKPRATDVMVGELLRLAKLAEKISNPRLFYAQDRLLLTGDGVVCLQMLHIGIENEDVSLRDFLDGNVPSLHRAGESNGELTKAEVALRDAVIDRLRENGIDVVTDVSEGQRVLDMANGKERLSGKQKRALETAEQSQRTTIATVVSSADGAKVLNNLDNLAKKLLEKESNRSKTFMGDVARAIGAKEKGSSSQYATFETKNGTVVTIRLANHNAKVSNFDNAGKDNAISIVITRKPNKGMTNDGTAHIVEFYYPETALQRADGKPLAEIVRSIKQALYSGEFKDTTGIAERQEVNGDVVREHRVYHGSGADFDSFDHSHMGEGEGAQAYGWGTYVTEVEGIGRTYAISNTTKRNDALRALEHDIDAISGQLDMHRNGLKNDEEQLKRANDWRAEAELDYELFQEKAEERKKEYGEDSPEYRNLLFNDIYTDEMKRAQRSVESTEDSIRYRKEKIAELEKALNDKKAEMDELPEKFPRHLYSVEIPDDNGKNYLDWNERLSDSQIEAIRAYLSENYRRNKLEDFDASIAEVKDAPNADEVNAWARRGENVYKMLSHLLGSDDAASKALSEMGFAGIKYPAENRSGGRKDGAKNYVIFNENDAKIVDKVRFFKTQGGEAYGFTVGGKIYIDPRIASSETAVHEYAHLWAEALRSANAKEWSNVVGLMRGTSVWNEVMERYPELKSDDEIADEVLATYSGRRGSERLREEMDRIKGSERSVADKARALGALERVKRALDRFWHGVADFLGIHYKSADEVADRVMKDLLNGVDPRRFVKGESDGRVREQFVGEDGMREGRGEQGRSLRGDEALTALNRIFDGEVKDELPPTIPTIEKFRQIFSKPIRTFLGELIKVKDNVYNKIQKEKRTRVSGAVMPTIKNADFAMRDTDGSTLYIKRFNNNTSDSTYNIAVVNKHGEVEDYISSVHIKRDANLRNKIKNGAELLLPNKRNGDGTVSRNNSTPNAKLGKISEKSDANGTLFRDDVDGAVSSSGVDGMRERAVELGRELGADVDVVSDVSEITDPNPEVQERKRRAKGWYDAKTGRVVINLAAHSDMADVEQTLLHEIVGHRGLRGLVGHENFNGFLDGIYEHASDGVREGIDDIARRKGCSKRVATEEYMSGLAEGGFADRKNAGLWQQIRQWFGDMLSRAKIKLNFSISDNELRYLLWRSHELSRMNGREGVVGRARDLAMQNRLGVGNGVRKGGESAVDSYDGDLETLFRDADSPVDYERALIRDSYERRLKDVWFQSREALQDGMLSLKETMKDIWRSAGKKFSQITDIPDYANPYLGQNRLSSRNAAEVRDFKHNLFGPLLREVGRLTGFSADGRAKLTDYMMAKHGLERNKVMAERDAKAAYEAEKLKDPNTTKTLADFVAEYRKKDYSGLTSLTGLDDVAAAEAEAKNMVADYEANHDTANLWARTKAVTDAIVQKQYDSGYINSITRNAILNMYDNYIPLRGFEDKTAEDVYSYMKHSNSVFNAPIKTARGRKSKADDPFANMLAMAESGIMRGNRNKLVKLPLLSLVLEHPTDLISVSDVWFVLLLAMCKF